MRPGEKSKKHPDSRPPQIPHQGLERKDRFSQSREHFPTCKSYIISLSTPPGHTAIYLSHMNKVRILLSRGNSSVAALISSSVAQGFEIYWDTTGIEDAASVNASIGGEEVDFTDSEGFDLLIGDVDIDLVKGNGLTLESGYSDGYVTSGWNGGGSDYLEFTITPGAGESINFEYAAELLIDLQTDISLFQFQLYSSLDGYTSPVATSDTYPFDPSDLSDENTFQSSQFLDLSSLWALSLNRSLCELFNHPEVPGALGVIRIRRRSPDPIWVF
jgi:hypothetical protein